MRIKSLFILTLPLVGFALFALLFFIGLKTNNEGGQTSTLIGKKTPQFNLEQLGDYISPTDTDLQTHQVKLVNFWASWCAPCRAEHPNLEQLNNQGVTIFGVNYKDVPDQAIRFLEELGNPYQKLGTDRNGRVAINWGVYGIPETFVIDNNGIVRLRWAGPVTSRVLDSHIMPMLEEIRQEIGR